MIKVCLPKWGSWYFSRICNLVLVDGAEGRLDEGV